MSATAAATVVVVDVGVVVVVNMKFKLPENNISRAAIYRLSHFMTTKLMLLRHGKPAALILPKFQF